MSWKENMEKWGGGDIAFLSEDGEVIIFVVVADCVLLEGKYKNRPSERIGCPVVTQDGYTLFVAGKRIARRLSRFEDQFKTAAFMLVRRGEHNDIETSYELSVCEDSETTKRLFALAKKDFKPEMVKDSIDAANEIMKG